MRQKNKEWVWSSSFFCLTFFCLVGLGGRNDDRSLTLFPPTILGGILVGYLLDRWFNTSPWMVIAGIVLGLTNAIIGLIRVMNRLNRSD